MNNLMYIGQSALLNSQYAITVHGNNVANQEVPGYRRRTVAMSENISLNTAQGQVGTGASVQGLLRHFNSYLEAQYLKQNSDAASKQTLFNVLSQIETRFVEDEKYGTAALLNNFWSAWGTLMDSPDQSAARSTLLSSTDSLTARLNDLAADLLEQQRLLERSIASEVAETNALLKELAGLNGRITASPASAELLDQRDRLLRSLSDKVDIEVRYREDGQVVVATRQGQTLVDGGSAYDFELLSPRATASLMPSSGFAGQICFEGASSHEYTIEVVDGGVASGGGATFRVSLDGGKTWLTDENGATKLFAAGPKDEAVDIGGVSIWFGSLSNGDLPEGSALASGDRFTVMPKTTLVWNSTAGGQVNVTPLDGNTKAGRLSGGSLAGLFEAREAHLGGYREQLDAFAASLIWEVNRVHSQGAGLSPLASATGIYAAQYTNVPLAASGLAFADRVTAGSFSLALFDETTGKPLGVSAVDFSSLPPGVANFDPEVHSLEDVAAAITASFPGQLTATVRNGRLEIAAEAGVRFEYADDTAGVFAATGHNCFLSGTGAGDIAVNPALAANPDRICAGHVNGQGEANTGDNTTARAMEALANAQVSFRTPGGVVTTSLGEYFASLVAAVGGDKAAAKSAWSFAEALAASLDDQQESVGGVNLDEELALLSRQQQNYQAASRLIQVSLEMMDTILGLK